MQARISDLVKSAHSGGEKAKMNLLSELFDLGFRQGGGGAVSSYMQSDILNSLLPFLQDESVAIRGFVLHVIAEGVRSEMEPFVLTSCKEAILRSLHSDSLTISKKAVQTATLFWKQIYKYHPPIAEDLVDALFRFLHSPPSDALRIHILKFLEVVISSTRGERLLRSLFDILITLRPVRIHVISAILHSLTNIVSAHRDLADVVFPELDNFYSILRTAASVSDIQSKFILLSLKSCLQLLLSISSAEASSRIQVILTEITRLTQGVSGAKRKESVDSSRSAKRPRLDVDGKKGETSSSLIAIDKDVKLLIDHQKAYFRETPPEIVELITFHMRFFSLSLDPRSSSRIADPRAQLPKPTTAASTVAPPSLPPSLPVVHLSPLQLQEQGTKSFDRIISLRCERTNELSLIFRRILMVRLARSRGSATDLLIEHLSTDPWRRREVILQFLCDLSSCESLGGGSSRAGTAACDHYCAAFIDVLKGVIGKMSEEAAQSGDRTAFTEEYVVRLFVFLLRECPRIPDALFQFLEILSTDSTTYGLDFPFLATSYSHFFSP